jgi:hypothetical protein
LGTKSAGKALRSRQLVGFYPGAVTRPGELSVSDEEVARMAGARGFSATGAVTMEEAGGLPGHYELLRAAQAGSFQGLLGHGQIPL